MSSAVPSAGRAFRQAVSGHKPLQVLGVVNAYTALLAQRAGAKALYVSGSGVATASHGLPDLGITNLADVVEDVQRITSVTREPLLVDVDTGFGSAFGITRTIRELERAGAGAVHLEDQAAAKRCGHRPNKQIVAVEEMCDRIRVAVAARTDPDFVIMARTDAIASEGEDAAIERAKAYVAAGADMLFPEACVELRQYSRFHEALPNVPILANITEFGQTPLFSVDELASAGVAMALYPLSAHRAQAKAAIAVFDAILRDGNQKAVLDTMQTRDELYEAIGYHEYEQFLDRLQQQRSSSSSSPSSSS